MKLELRGITKRFGVFTAIDHIDLTVEPGEIHCLLGENGAGKSTLMNVLYGLYRADEGEILLDDRVQHFEGPGDAMAAGVGMVHQHFMLIPVFTVAENVMLGNEATKAGGLLDLAAARIDRGFQLVFLALEAPVGPAQHVEQRAVQPRQVPGKVQQLALQHARHLVDRVGQLVAAVLDMHAGVGMREIASVDIGYARHGFLIPRNVW